MFARGVTPLILGYIYIYFYIYRTKDFSEMPLERVNNCILSQENVPRRTNFTQLQAIIREQAYHFMV